MDESEFKKRKNNLITKAFVSASSALLFFKIGMEPLLLYQVIGIIFVICSALFLISTLFLIFSKLNHVTKFIELSADSLGSTFIISSFVIFLTSWAEGIEIIDKNSWFYQFYIRIGPVWLCILALIIITTGLYLIAKDAKQKGAKIAMQNLLVYLSFALGIAAITIIINPIIELKYAITLIAIGLICISGRFLIHKNESKL